MGGKGASWGREKGVVWDRGKGKGGVVGVGWGVRGGG